MTSLPKNVSGDGGDVPGQCLSRPLICTPLCLCMTALVPLPGEALMSTDKASHLPVWTRGESVWPDAGQTRAHDKLTSLGLFLPCRNPSWKLGIVLACTPRTGEVEVGVQGNSQLHPQLELWATLPTQTKEVKSFPENKRIK